MKNSQTAYIVMDQALQRASIPCNLELTSAQIGDLQKSVLDAIKKLDYQALNDILTKHNPLDLQLNHIYDGDETYIGFILFFSCFV